MKHFNDINQRATGIEVLDETAKVDKNTGQITSYHTSVKLAFRVEWNPYFFIFL